MTRFRSALRFVLHWGLASIVLYTVPWLVGAAAAATAGLPPAPPPDALLAYVQANGVVVAGVTVAYVAARWLLQRNDSTHWIAKGRVLAAIAAATGVAGTALLALTNGTPWSGVLVTAVLGLLHLVDSTGPAPVAKQGQGGFARVGLLVAIALVGALTLSTGCAGSTQATRQTTLSTATVVATTMLKTVESYDKVAGDAIVAGATTAASGQASLVVLRARVRKCLTTIGAAIDAISTAKTVNDDTSLAGVQKALNEIISDVTDLTGGK